MKQVAKVAFLAVLDCSAEQTRARRHHRVMSADEPTLISLARDILAVEAAAKAGATIDGDDEAATAAANRMLSWAKAQLKSTEELQAAAAVAGPEDVLAADEWPAPKLLERAGPEDWERWAFARRAGAFHKNQVGTGNAQGSKDALSQMRSLLMVCCAPECDALVDYKVARRHAKRAGRLHFEDGDGCAGPDCSADHRAPRFAKRQRQYADELENGKRLLVRWPVDRDDHAVYAYPEAAVRSAAASARMAL